MPREGVAPGLRRDSPGAVHSCKRLSLCRTQIGSTYPLGLDGWGWSKTAAMKRTEIWFAYLQMIVVGAFYGIDCTGCTTAVRRTRIVACENKHRQTTAELKAVATYTELEGVQPGINVKRKFTHLSFFDKDRTLWIVSVWSTWWLRSKCFLASCGYLVNSPAGCARTLDPLWEGRHAE